MYKNLKIERMSNSEELEIEGEMLLMHTEDYFPNALSAMAKIVKRAGKYVCHFEIVSEAEFFMTEAASFNFSGCLRRAENDMRKKINFWNSRSAAAT